MSEDASAGRLSIEVVGDTSRFRRGLQARIDAQTRDVRARIRAEIDTRGIRSRAQAAAREVSQQTRIRLRVEVDTRGVKTRVQAAAREVQQSARIRLRVEADTRGLMQSVQSAARAAEAAVDAVRVKVAVDSDRVRDEVQAAARDASTKVDVPVDANTDPARRQTERFRSEQSGRPIEIPVRVSGRGARSLTRVGAALTKIVGLGALLQGIGAGIAGLVGGVGALAGGLFAVVSAASQAAGALALLPAGLAVLAQGLGTTLAGFQGIGDAIKQTAAAEEEAASTSQAAATARAAAAGRVRDAQRGVQDALRNTQRVEQDNADRIADAQERIADARQAAARAAEAAAERVADAQRRVRDAQEAAAESATRAAERVADAERDLASAQDRARFAQEDLTRARETARERLEDLRLTLRGAALDEEAAVLGLERARERLENVNADERSTDRDKREADLAYRQAVLRLDEVRERNEDLNREGKAALAAGVKGSAEVAEANAAIAEAAGDVREAQAGVARARQEAARDEIAAAEDVADAERDLARARADAARSEIESREDIADAERDLARVRRDAAQATADAQRGLLDAQRNLRDAQRDLTAGAVATSAAATKAAAAMDNLSPAGRRFVGFMRSEFLPMLTRVRREAQENLLPGVQDGLTSLLALEPVLTGMVGRTGRVLGNFVRDFGAEITTPRWLADLDVIGRQNARTLASLGRSAINLLAPLRNIVLVAGEPGGPVDRFTQWLEVLTAAREETSNLNRESGETSAWLTRVGDTLAQWGRIIGNTWRGLRNLGRAATDSGQRLTDSLEDATADFAQWSEDNADRIREWFEAIEAPTRTIGRILVEVLAIIGRISDHPAIDRMLRAVEDDLLPALEDLLDALLDSGSGEEFIDLLTEVTRLVTALVRSGALGQLLSVLTDIFDAVADFAETEGGAEFFRALGGVLAVVGPMALIAGSIWKMARGLKAISRVSGITAILQGLFGVTPTGGKRKPGGVAGKRDKAGRAAGTRMRGSLGQAARGGGGTAVGVVGGITAGAVGGLIADDKGGGRDTLGGLVSGAGYGAGTGALIGSVIPGIGTAAGAVVGGAIGGLHGAAQGAGGMDNLRDQLDTLWEDINDRADQAGERWEARWDKIAEYAGDKARDAKEWARENLGPLGWLADRADTAGKRWEDRWDKIATYAGDRASDVRRWVNDHIGRMLRWLGDRADTAGQRWSERWDAIATYAGERASDARRWVNDHTGRLFRWLGDRADTAGQRWGKRWDAIAQKAGNRASDARRWVNDHSGRLFRWLEDRVSTARQRWSDRWDAIANAAGRRASDARRWATDHVVRLAANMRSQGDKMGERWAFRWRVMATYANNRMRDARVALAEQLLRLYNNVRSRVDGIGRAWDGLRSRFNSPVRFFVDVVYNRGIVPVWNAVANVVPGGKKLSTVRYSSSSSGNAGQGSGLRTNAARASGGILPGYSPGRDDLEFMSQEGDRLALSGGEGIMRPEWTRAVGRGYIDAANNAARRGRKALARFMGEHDPRRGYASGGILDKFTGLARSRVLAAYRGVGDLGDRLRGGADWIKEGIASAVRDAGGWVVGKLKDTAAAALGPTRALIRSNLTQVGPAGSWPKMIGGLATAPINALLGQAGKADEAATAALTGGDFGRVGNWPPRVLGRVSPNTAAAAAYVRRAFGVNNIGTLGQRSNKSDHPWGKALDAMIPNYRSASGKALGSRIASWFVGNAGKFGTKYVIWSDRINTGSGWRGYRHPSGSTNDTLAHRDHVHVSFLGDGATVRPRKGGTAAILGEKGRAEAVVDEGLLNARMADLADVRALLEQMARRPLGNVTVPVYPQPGQSEAEIGAIAAARVGWALTDAGVTG